MSFGGLRTGGWAGAWGELRLLFCGNTQNCRKCILTFGFLYGVVALFFLIQLTHYTFLISRLLSHNSVIVPFPFSVLTLCFLTVAVTIYLYAETVISF